MWFLGVGTLEWVHCSESPGVVMWGIPWRITGGRLLERVSRTGPVGVWGQLEGVVPKRVFPGRCP